MVQFQFSSWHAASLGLRLEPTHTAKGKEYGYRVAWTRRGGKAAGAGVSMGMVLLFVDGQDVEQLPTRDIHQLLKENREESPANNIWSSTAEARTRSVG